MNILTFGGIVSTDFNVYTAGPGLYTKPTRQATAYHIPGKNGDLVIDGGGFSNIDVEYQCVLPQTFRRDFDSFCAAMYAKRGYQRLEETDRPDFYRLATFTEGFTPKPTQTYAGGSFRLTFSAMPQRFLKSGEKAREITAEKTVVHNPTEYAARPLIRVYGHGALKIGNMTATIAEHSQVYMDIDCDSMDAFCGAYNLNDKLTLTGHQFPELAPGDNNIQKEGTISKIMITPRWWTI